MLKQCLDCVIWLYASMLNIGKSPRITGIGNGPETLDRPMAISADFELTPQPVRDFIATVKRSKRFNDGKIRKRKFTVARRLNRYAWFRNCSIMLQKKADCQSVGTKDQNAEVSTEKRRISNTGTFWVDRRPVIENGCSPFQQKDAWCCGRVQHYNPDLEAARRRWVALECDKTQVRRRKVWKPLPLPISMSRYVGH